MLEQRIIPVLQISGKKAVKTTKFADRRYLGDPVNIAMIWSDSNAHEIIVTDIDHHLNTEQLRNIARNVFIPVSYGGGIKTIDDAHEALQWGCEKIILCTWATPDLIEEIANEAGKQSVAVCIDYDNNGMTYVDGGKLPTGVDIINRIKEAQNAGAGEIILHSIERDGTFSGLDIETAKKLAQLARVPSIMMGGASSGKNIRDALNTGISGCAAGSLFCFDGPRKNVLVSYIKY